MSRVELHTPLESSLVYRTLTAIVATGKRGWNSHQKDHHFTTASKKGAQAHHMWDAARHACETDRGVSQYSTHEEHTEPECRDRDWTGERGQTPEPEADRTSVRARCSIVGGPGGFGSSSSAPWVLPTLIGYEHCASQRFPQPRINCHAVAAPPPEVAQAPLQANASGEMR